MVYVKTFKELSTIDFFQIAQLRQAVFMIEQRIDEVDLDEYDLTALHLFIKDDGEIVSYARLIYHDDDYYIGRVVTKSNYRKQGYATQIMTYLMERYDCLCVSSQVPTIPFYQKLGFKVVGKKYKEAGIPHQKLIYIK